MTQLTTAELKELNDKARPYGGPFLCTSSGTALVWRNGKYMCPKCGWSWNEAGDPLGRQP